MSEATYTDGGVSLTRLATWPPGRTLALTLAIAATGVTVGYLVAAGLWYVALALVLVLPGFVVLQRAPLAAIALWLLFAPYLLQTDGVPRYGYWIVHRALPVITLVVLVASRALGLRARPFGRLGGPEVLMATYVLVTTLSIAYTSTGAATSLIVLYDRVVIPMCLYLIVRLIRPTDESLRWLVPMAAIVLVAQTALGVASWAAPETLPSDWIGRVGSRTIGSLGSPSVYGVTVLAAGAYLLHAAATAHRRVARIALRALFGVAVVMAVVTFSRGVWLAAVVVVIAATFVHPASLRRLAFAVAPILVVLAFTGAASGQIETIEQRFGSDDTALERLPIALASLRMFEEKPLHGWGYGTFDEFDRQFQSAVGGFIPEKDHASHNVYLTLLAEQGLIGVLLFLGPAIWLLARTIGTFSRLPRTGLASRKLIVLLWAVLLAHVAVNNFSNMRVVYGLGQWWLALGLIAALVSAPAAGERDEPSPVRSRASW